MTVSFFIRWKLYKKGKNGERDEKFSCNGIQESLWMKLTLAKTKRKEILHKRKLLQKRNSF